MSGIDFAKWAQQILGDIDAMYDAEGPYEHIGDLIADVRPLCTALVETGASAPTSTQTTPSSPASSPASGCSGECGAPLEAARRESEEWRAAARMHDAQAGVLERRAEKAEAELGTAQAALRGLHDRLTPIGEYAASHSDRDTGLLWALHKVAEEIEAALAGVGGDAPTKEPKFSSGNDQAEAGGDRVASNSSGGESE